LKAEGKAVNPIVVLTVVLAIIFLVLLVVLIVLIGRKPQKSEEYGESYY
jgi:preprotein translocase subunit SecG